MMIAWTMKRTMEETGLSRSALYKLLKDGKLNRRKVGRRTYVCPNEVKALFALQSAGGNNDQ